MCNTSTEIIDMGIGLLSLFRLHLCVEEFYSPTLTQAGLITCLSLWRVKPHLRKCA